jgi:hypothetical protein
MVAASFGFTWFMRLFLCLIQPTRQLFYSPSFNEKSLQDRYGRSPDFRIQFLRLPRLVAGGSFTWVTKSEESQASIRDFDSADSSVKSLSA